jgi:hypothetical protein
MNIRVGDRVELRKQHPCGGISFEVMREGMDFRLKCETCGAMIWLKRRDLEKRIKKHFPK